MAPKRSERGGWRPGAGRPKGTGGPPELVRRNRFVLLFTDAEIEGLERWAQEREIPAGRLVHELVVRAMRGAGRRGRKH